MQCYAQFTGNEPGAQEVVRAGDAYNHALPSSELGNQCRINPAGECNHALIAPLCDGHHYGLIQFLQVLCLMRKIHKY